MWILLVFYWICAGFASCMLLPKDHEIRTEKKENEHLIAILLLGGFLIPSFILAKLLRRS